MALFESERISHALNRLKRAGSSELISCSRRMRVLTASSSDSPARSSRSASVSDALAAGAVESAARCAPRSMFTDGRASRATRSRHVATRPGDGRTPAKRRPQTGTKNKPQPWSRAQTWPRQARRGPGHQHPRVPRRDRRSAASRPSVWSRSHARQWLDRARCSLPSCAGRSRRTEVSWVARAPSGTRD